MNLLVWHRNFKRFFKGCLICNEQIYLIQNRKNTFSSDMNALPHFHFTINNDRLS